LNSCSTPLSTEKWLSVSTTSLLPGAIQGEIISRPTWPPPGGVPTITGAHSPGVVVVLVVVDELVVGVAGVVAALGLLVVEEDVLVSLPLATQSGDAPVVVPVSVVGTLGDAVVVVVVTVSVAVTAGGVALGVVPVLELAVLVVKLALVVDGLGRFG
jgi:hypothetical protein